MTFVQRAVELTLVGTLGACTAPENQYQQLLDLPAAERSAAIGRLSGPEAVELYLVWSLEPLELDVYRQLLGMDSALVFGLTQRLPVEADSDKAHELIQLARDLMRRARSGGTSTDTAAIIRATIAAPACSRIGLQCADSLLQVISGPGASLLQPSR